MEQEYASKAMKDIIFDNFCSYMIEAGSVSYWHIRVAIILFYVNVKPDEKN